jgi:hypothetical protein
MQWSDNLYGTVKNGVLVIDGIVSSVRVDNEMLVIRDGIKGQIVEQRFNRAHCPISRLISIQGEGYITYGAIRWLHDIGASFVHLRYDGTPILVSCSLATVPRAVQRS